MGVYTDKDIIGLTNAYRAEQGLPPLTANDVLTRAAQYRADDMAKTSNFSHRIATTTPDMTHWKGFLKGYNYVTAGENLARGFSDPKRMLAKLKASPSHNKNLTEKNFKDIGVGIARGTKNGKPVLYVVQFFGTQPAAKRRLSP